MSGEVSGCTVMSVKGAAGRSGVMECQGCSGKMGSHGVSNGTWAQTPRGQDDVNIVMLPQQCIHKSQHMDTNLESFRLAGPACSSS